MAVVILGEVLLKGWGFWNFSIFLVNVIIVGSITFALIAILGWQIGQIISLLFFASIYLIDYYVIKFKGTPIVPWDIKAIKTAMAVSGKYSFAPETGTVLFSSAIIVFAIVSVYLIKKQDYRCFSFRRRAVILVGSTLIGLLVVSSPVLNSFPANAWGKDITYCYKEYGTISSFVNYYIKNRVQKPTGYSKNYVNELIKNYSTNDMDQSIKDNDHPDKIIMIMNESFADLDQFSNSISINEMPYFKELSKESLTGDLCVSVRGGGTCNTEFEALTGFSMLFLPGASYPFVSYMDDKEVFSLAKFFRGKDYSVASLHLAEKSNWSRDKAYRTMGLEPFYSIDDYKNISMLRGFATDEFDYKKLVEIENNMPGEKKFLFNVTIQNHGGYDNPEGLNFLEDLSGLDDYISAQVYYSLIKESDNALKELVDYYREDKQKTMIVFFGDHQPALESEVQQKLEINQDYRLDAYITLFLIWKNYGNDMKSLGTVSANYIPLIIMKEANFPLPPFMKIVDEAYKSFPVLTTQGIIDSKGRYYRNLSDIPYSKKELDDYMIAQYEELFGDKSFSKAVH